MFRWIIFYLLITNLSVSSHDIFDMFGDVKIPSEKKIDNTITNVKETVQKNVDNQKKDETSSVTFKTQYQTVVSAYRHLIQHWMKIFPSNDANEYRLLLQLSLSEFKRLNQFATASNYDEKNVIHEVHVISDLLKRAVYKIEEDKSTIPSITWSAWLRTVDINIILQSGVLLGAVGLISFISVRAHLNRNRWFTTFFMLAFTVSVFQNWYALYLEALAKIDEVLIKKLPEHCLSHSKGFFHIMTAAITGTVQGSNNECLEYQKALRAMPHFQATIIQGVSMTFAQLFTTPLGTVGEKLSEFFAGTMLHVPILVWPIVMAVIVLILIIFLLINSKYEVHLPFMMGSIRPSPHGAITKTNDMELENALNDSRKTIEQLENKIEKLEQKNLALQCNINSSIHVNRSLSNERTNLHSERLSENQRENFQTIDNNELRQQQTSSVRASRSSTNDTGNLQRDRSSSNHRTKDNSGRSQEKTPSNFEFPDGFVPD